MKTYINYIWCYKKDCTYFVPAGDDSEGKFGACSKKEVNINRIGRCISYEKIPQDIEDKSFYIHREAQDYINEVKKIKD